MVTIFQILTGENWNAAMYDGMRGAGTSWKPAAGFMSCYYLLLIILGMFIVMNLFLAILLSKFEGNEDLVKKPDPSSRSLGQISKRIRQTFSKVSAFTAMSPAKAAVAADTSSAKYEPATTGADEAKVGDKSTPAEPHDPVTDAVHNVKEGVQDVLDLAKTAPDRKHDVALYCFPANSPFRIKCNDVVSAPWFDNTIVIIILISSILLAATAGPDEVRAWTIRKGFKAPQAAGTIHTDFEKKFIMAETMAFADLKEAGSEMAVRSAGKYRQEGKGYEVVDGDIIFFKVGK